MQFPVKLAVASKEGLAISEHFGHARHFGIWEASPQTARLIDTREVDHYCLGGEGNGAALPAILAAVKDCHAVLVARIGDGPTERLRAIGVAAVADYAWQPIEASLLDYARRLAAGAP